ncbi:MAG: lipid-A-disaccharide synthase [Candidatus Eremiobacterota bacterium]
MSRTLFIATAEPSGDLQGGALARALKMRHPDWRILGTGSSAMRDAGVDLLFDSATWGTIGHSEVLARLPRLLWAYRSVCNTLLRLRPDLLVVIDAPGLHFRLAGFAQRHGIRCVYYFPPSQWATNPRRLHQIHGRVTAVVTAFRFNADQYLRNGLEVGYFGHPLVDIVGPPPRAEDAQRALGLPPGRYVALLPGSRTQEVKLLLPSLLEVAARLRSLYPDLGFLIPIANPALESRVRAHLPRPPAYVHLLHGRSREAMACSRVVVMASGSASLEAALLGVPHVVFYRANRVDWLIYRLFSALGWVRVDRFGLCNLVLQEDVMPEFLQHTATPDRLTAEAAKLIEDGPDRFRMLDDLARVRQAVGSPGVVERVARFVEQLAEGVERSRALSEVSAAWTS